MKKLYIFFGISFLVPLSLFSAASEITPEWVRDRQLLDEVETARRSFIRSHDEVKQGLDLQQGGQNLEQMVGRLRELMGQMAVLLEREYGELLHRYPYEREHWIDTYNAINATRRRIQRMQRGIPEDE